MGGSGVQVGLLGLSKLQAASLLRCGYHCQLVCFQVCVLLRLSLCVRSDVPVLLAMISSLPRWLNNYVAFQWAAHLIFHRNDLLVGTERVFVAALRKYQLGKGGRVRSSVFDILAALLRRVAVYNDWLIACRGVFNLWVSHEHTEHRLVSRSGSVLETLEVLLPFVFFEAEGFSIP